jgi:uncharacterized membrane protein
VAVVAGYFLISKPQPAAGYNTIYLLDNQKKAVDYPVTLVANQNSTFNVWIGAVNNMGGSGNQTYQVLVKITPNLSNFPVEAQPIQTYDLSLANGATWQAQSSIMQNQVGNYSIVFELWHYNADANVKAFQFTHDYCVLNIQVVS